MLAASSWNACLRGLGSVDVVLFGVDAAHLHSNMASSLKPLLPDADRTKLAALFGHLTGIGLDGPQRALSKELGANWRLWPYVDAVRLACS